MHSNTVVLQYSHSSCHKRTIYTSSGLITDPWYSVYASTTRGVTTATNTGTVTLEVTPPVITPNGPTSTLRPGESGVLDRRDAKYVFKADETVIGTVHKDSARDAVDIVGKSPVTGAKFSVLVNLVEN